MISVNSNNNALKYFKYKLTSRKSTLIMLIVLNVISYPLLFGTFLASTKIAFMQNMLTSSAIICVFSLAVIYTTGIYIAISTLDYYHNKNVVDMNLSLPLTTSQRFWADFLSGLSMYVVPYICSSVIGLIFFYIGKAIGINEPNPENSYNFASSFLDINFPAYMLTGLVSMIMLYSLVMLITSCCGSIVEATIYSLVSNLVLVIAAVLTTMAIASNLYGVRTDDILTMIISSVSPLGLIGSTFINIASDQSIPLLQPPILLSNIIFITLCILGSYFAAKRRKAEQVGKPFVFRAAYHTIMAMSIFCVICPFVKALYSSWTTNTNLTSVPSMIITMIVTSFIVFFVLDTITGRGFKKFYLSLLRYTATSVGCIGLSFIIISAKGFGISEYIPDINNISYIEFSYESPNYPYPYMENTDESLLIIDDKSSFDEVMSLHSEQIKLYKSEHEYYDNNFYIEMTYHQFWGGTVKRYYFVNNDFIKTIKSFPISEKTRQLRVERYTDKIKNARDIYAKDGVNVSDISSNKQINIKITKDQLLNALQTDILNETDDEIKSPYLPKAIINIYNQSNSFTSSSYHTIPLYIKPNWKNTIELLRNNGAAEIVDSNFVDFLIDNQATLYKTSNDKYASYWDISNSPSELKYLKIDNKIKDFLSKCYISHNIYDYHSVPNKYFVRITGGNGELYLIVPDELYDQASEFAKIESSEYIETNYNDFTAKVLETAGIEFLQLSDNLMSIEKNVLDKYNQNAKKVFVDNDSPYEYTDTLNGYYFGISLYIGYDKDESNNDFVKTFFIVTPDNEIVSVDGNLYL